MSELYDAITFNILKKVSYILSPHYCTVDLLFHCNNFSLTEKLVSIILNFIGVPDFDLNEKLLDPEAEGKNQVHQ